MADRELWYASGGPLLYDDTEIATNWYPAPYDILPLRAALLSQAYLTDAPVNDIEVARRMDVDGTPGTILKAGASGLPADSVITEDGTNITITGRNLLLSLTGAWSLGSATVLLAGVFSNAFRMPTGAGAGKIIESDADGDFSWVTHIVPTHNILSASHADSLIASVILGDILHGNVTPVWARLAGNITTTKKFLTQIGTGAISAIPIWDTIVDGDVPATHSGSAHHVAVTVSAPISLSGQALSLVNNAIAPDTITAIDVGVLANSDTVIPTSKAVTTAIGATGHAAVTLSVAAEVLLGLSTQELSLDTQTANLLFAGPVSGAVAAPTFRALVNADFPATLNPTFAGLGATPIITSYAGSQVIGGAVSGNVGLSVFVSPSTPTGNVWGTQYLQVLTPGGTNKAAAGVYFGTYCFMVAGQVHTSFVSLDVTAPYIIPASGASVTESTTFRVVGASTAGVKNYAVNILAGASRFGALTASLPIVTNSDKVLASLAYTGATSLRKNLGLETDDSPTFVDINATGVFKVDSVQVVSNRVVDATINNSIEAAFTALYPLASALLAGIQTAIKTHGLMAAA